MGARAPVHSILKFRIFETFRVWKQWKTLAQVCAFCICALMSMRFGSFSNSEFSGRDTFLMTVDLKVQWFHNLICNKDYKCERLAVRQCDINSNVMWKKVKVTVVILAFVFLNVEFYTFKSVFLITIARIYSKSNLLKKTWPLILFVDFVLFSWIECVVAYNLCTDTMSKHALMLITLNLTKS